VLSDAMKRERTTQAMDAALAEVTKAERAAQTEIVRHQLEYYSGVHGEDKGQRWT